MSPTTALQTQPLKRASLSAQQGLLQRKCACGRHTTDQHGECTECRKKRMALQRRAVNQGGPNIAPPIVHEVLRSPGRPLDPATRAFMEPRFGHDFSRVRLHSATSSMFPRSIKVGPLNDQFETQADAVSRQIDRVSNSALSRTPRYDFGDVQIHTDAQAARSAQRVNALAYTVKNQIVFGANQYQPHTSSGRQLLAHELTHVVQQNAAAGVSDTMQRTVGASSNCPANVHNAPADPLARLGHIDARAQLMSLGSSHLLAFESLLFSDPTFGPSGVFNAYRDWFGTPVQTASGRWRSRFRTATFATENEAITHEMGQFSARFETIHRWLSGNISYRCPGTSVFTIPGCRPGRCTHDAITCPTGSRMIVICPTFWGHGDDGLASLLIHEAMHARFHFRSHSTSTPLGRSRNPACYQGFVDTIYNTGALPTQCNVI